MDNRLTLLHQLADLIGKESDLNELLESMSHIAKDLVEADRCSIYIYDHSRHLLQTTVAHGVEGKITIPLGSGIAGYVAEHKSVQLVNDTELDSRFKCEVDKATGYQTRNILTLPIEDREKNLLGVIQLLNKKEGDFIDEDTNTVQLLTQYLGLLLENAVWREELEKKVQSKTDELQRVVNILQYKVATNAQKSQNKDKALASAILLKQKQEMLTLIAAQWENPLDELLGISKAFTLQAELETVTSSDIVVKMEQMESLIKGMSQTISLFKNYNQFTKNVALHDVATPIDNAIKLLQNELLSISFTFNPKFLGKFVTNMVQLSQVMINLMSAILHNSEEKTSLDIDINCDNKTILYILKESSSLMNDHHQQKLFDPTFTLSDLSVGEDLSLFIAKSIVLEQLKGKFWSKKEEGHNTFYIQLPLFI
jgi:GAF domain-containing protein